jgi:hypothetical protein
LPRAWGAGARGAPSTFCPRPPIYWGPPTAIFNEDAFIRCGDDLGACAARVAAVAANFSAYRGLAEAPPLAPGGLALLDGTAAVADALAGLRPSH